MLAVYPPLRQPERADVVVIGAGITGALVAHSLAGAGADVIVVDKRDVANGSSAATSGLLMHETDTSLVELSARVGEASARRAWQLGVEAIDHLEAAITTLPDRCGFERRDSLYLASSRRAARQMPGEIALRRRLGFTAEWIEAAELKTRYGIAAHGGILTSRNAQVDCFRLAHRLLQFAAGRGARIYDRTEVARVEAHDTGLVVTVAGGATIRAQRVVWAAGYEGVEEVQQRVGQLRSTWVVASEPLPPGEAWPDQVLIWETARPYLYARVTDDGRALIGGEDERFGTRHTNEKVMARKAARLVTRFGALVPDMAPIEPTFRWGGTFSETSDGLPYIGSVPEHPHAWLALGYGGNGITFSAIAAQLIRDEWLGRANLDAEIFAFDRH